MKEKQIMVVIKRPGEAPFVEPLFENTLESFQAAVGGFIETVTIASDLVIICNEEGRIHKLPFNCELFGIGFVGTILAVGSAGEDFSSIKAKHIPLVLRFLGGRHGET